MPNIRKPLLAELQNQMTAMQQNMARLQALIYVSPTLSIPREEIDPVYYSDDYPREGCKLVIDVQKRGFFLAVYEPGGNRICGYGAALTAKAIGGMVEVWCSGGTPELDGAEFDISRCSPPPPDQPPSGKRAD